MSSVCRQVAFENGLYYGCRDSQHNCAATAVEEIAKGNHNGAPRLAGVCLHGNQSRQQRDGKAAEVNERLSDWQDIHLILQIFLCILMAAHDRDGVSSDLLH
jgi:hypothetical protein